MSLYIEGKPAFWEKEKKDGLTYTIPEKMKTIPEKMKTIPEKMKTRSRTNYEKSEKKQARYYFFAPNGGYRAGGCDGNGNRWVSKRPITSIPN